MAPAARANKTLFVRLQPTDHGKGIFPPEPTESATNAQTGRTSKPEHNQTSVAGIIHQLAVCTVVLTLGPAALHVAADVVDVLLVNGESSSRCVFAKREQLRLRVLFSGGDARVDGNQRRIAHKRNQIFAGEVCS